MVTLLKIKLRSVLWEEDYLQILRRQSGLWASFAFQDHQCPGHESRCRIHLHLRVYVSWHITKGFFFTTTNYWAQIFQQQQWFHLVTKRHTQSFSFQSIPNMSVLIDHIYELNRFVLRIGWYVTLWRIKICLFLKQVQIHVKVIFCSILIIWD